jgi:GTPase SAR1 family protein
MLKDGEENVVYILGSKGVGKTSLANILSGKDFNENEIHTNRTIKTCHYQSENKNLTLKELTDDENFTKTGNLKNCLEELIAIIVLFSVDDEKSLEYAESLILFIKSNLTYNLDLKIILIGNKHDRKKNNDTNITVNLMEAENFAIKNDIYDYYISCKTKYNIESIQKILEDINESKYIDREENAHEDSATVGSTKANGSCQVI